MPIKYIVKDVREPIGEGKKLICHCVNDIPAMGSGVAKALLDKWPIVRSAYMEWGKRPNTNFGLGKIQALKVEDDIAVVNMVGQHGIHSQNGLPPIRYDAIRSACKKTCIIAKRYKATVHIPYLLGCDLAGGNWEIVEKIFLEELCEHGIEVTAYDLFNKRGIE